MNATELFHQDGKPANVFCCGQCKNFFRQKEWAEECCTHHKCAKCRGLCEQRYYRLCDACQAEERQEKEQARFAAAEKIPADQYLGWVYSEGAGGDCFLKSAQALMDDLENSDPGNDSVEYAWACNPVQFAHVDMDDIMRSIEENGDAYEDFDSNYLSGILELGAAIDVFNKANEGIVSYQPDYKRAVILPKGAV
jgi:hypothetical protein